MKKVSIAHIIRDNLIYMFCYNFSLSDGRCFGCAIKYSCNKLDFLMNDKMIISNIRDFFIYNFKYN